MLLDYIYLLIILVLIGTVLFFIWLSYEYRIFDNIESFIVLERPSLSATANPNYLDNINNFAQKYSNLVVNTYNKQITNNEVVNNLLLKQFQSNYNDSKNLLKEKRGLEPNTQSFPINELIKTIKSNYNSQYLSLFSNDINKYGVLVNDKCITVNGLCKDEYCLQDCQNSLYTSDSQKFYTNRIYSDDDVSRIMKIPKNKVNTNNIYPFNIFRSTINDKCLTINNDGISIDNCNLNSLSQQWSISPNENICVLK
jgi:hypothetical protein